jgi:hypothetical protein
VNLAEVQMLADFRRRFRSLTWDQLGLLFGVDGIEAREQWLVYTDRCVAAPAWWRAARDLYGEGLKPWAIARELGRPNWAVKRALQAMEIDA